MATENQKLNPDDLIHGEAVVCEDCKLILCQPQECSACRLPFCKACINKSGAEKCPKCTGDNFKEIHRFVRNVLAASRFKCSSENCPTVNSEVGLPYEEASTHILECPLALTKCRHPGCTFKGKRDHTQEH
jgi:hypothetical protein